MEGALVKQFASLLAGTVLLLTSTSHAQDRWQVSISGGVLSSTFFMPKSSGYMIGGTVFCQFSDSFQLSLSSGYHKWKEELGPGGNSLAAVPLLAGVRLPFPAGWVSPYISGELGVQFIRRKYIFQSIVMDRPGLSHVVSSSPATESATKFAMRFGAGVAIPIGNDFDIDVGARYDRIAYEFVYLYAVGLAAGSLDIFGIVVGLKWEL